jgi:Flp pilus assembly protein TadG
MPKQLALRLAGLVSAAGRARHRLADDERGIVAPIFAFLSIPLLTLLGITVDYSRANADRSVLQATLDSTALMLTREAVGLPAAELNRRANDYVRTMMPNSRINGLTVNATLTQLINQYRIDVRATGNVNADFAGFTGQSHLDIAADAQVVWGTKRLELALALDNTGSMAGSKIAALRDATHQLINILQSSARRPEDIRVAIIPFDRVVNIGENSPMVGQSWFDLNGSVTTGTSWNRFRGCVTDRDQPNDARDTAPTAGWSARVVAAPVSSNSSNNWQSNCNNGLAEILPLTNDWTAMRNKVNQMRAVGNTNVSIGVAWGMHALTPNLPLTGAEQPNEELEKYMVVLTDGENTQNRWTTNSSTIDTRTAAACAEAKALGIKVYTVRVINGDANLLRNCATNPGMFYDVQNVGQLVTVFGAIANSLAQKYISR